MPVEFDSEGGEIGRQGIDVDIICVKLSCECEINIEAGGLNTFYYFSN